MKRPADTTYPIHDLMRQRWSPVAFSDEPLTAEEVGSLLEAARWSASCFNEQPWSFILGRRAQADDFKRLLDCLAPANRTWCQQVPLLMLSVAKKAFDRNGKPNAHAWHDVGQAAAYLSTQATALGLFVHQMAGFDADKARRDLDIPDTHEPVAMIAVGRYGDFDALPDELKTRETSPRQRKPLREFVFVGRFGAALNDLR